MKIAIRIMGVLLGLLFVFFGIKLFIAPVFDSAIEKINAFSFLTVGAIFVIYGMAGIYIIFFKKGTQTRSKLEG